MSERLSCEIVGCQRTRKNPYSSYQEWICQKHWAAIPQKRRKFYFLMKRRYKDGKIDTNRFWKAWKKIKGIAHDNAWSV